MTARGAAADWLWDCDRVHQVLPIAQWTSSRPDGTSVRVSLCLRRESKLRRELVSDPATGSPRLNLRLEVEVSLSKVIASADGDGVYLSPEAQQLLLSRDSQILREASVPL